MQPALGAGPARRQVIRHPLLKSGGTSRERGAEIAALLARAWDPRCPPTAIADASPLATRLLASGAAPLAWWRLRSQPPAGTHQLEQAFHLQLLRAAAYERELAAIFQELRSLAIEAIVAKGWAAAKMYPEPGLRPYGDFDLYFFDLDSYHRAQAWSASGKHPVDLHFPSVELSDRPQAEVLKRSVTVRVGRSRVRLFSPEDHLRLLALHGFKHALARPLWLCDVAVALESCPATFDWDYFLSGDPRRTGWVLAVLELARQVLHADVSALPPGLRARSIPHWVKPSVLSLWGDPAFQSHGQREPLHLTARDPWALIRALRVRWPTPLEATIGVGVPLDRFPRLPIQIAECMRRAAKAAGALLRSATRVS